MRISHRAKLYRCVGARLGFPNATFFIATDSDSVTKDLKQLFGDRLVTSSERAIHTTQFFVADGAGSMARLAVLQKVWIDFFLLSLGHALFVTGGGRLSSFAEEAMFRQAIYPGLPPVKRCR